MRRSVFVVILGVMFMLKCAVAETLGSAPGGESSAAQRVNISGSVRGGYWTKSKQLDNEKDLITGALWLRMETKLGDHAGLVVEGREGKDHLFHGGAVNGNVREGYLHLRSDTADLRIGKQIIAWGKADQINPTDNLTPRDFTRYFSEDGDQRLGVTAVRAGYFMEGLTLTGIWLPYFKPNILPFPPETSALAYSQHAADSSKQQWAIKIDQSGQVVDWSLSYFDGYDLNPDVGIDSVTPAGVTLGLNHHRVRVLGGDVATTAGRYGLRAEAAYTFTDDSSGTDPQIKNPFFYIVLGADKTFLENLNINMQYFLRVVSRYHNPEEITSPLVRAVATQEAVLNNQLDATQQGVSLRISNQWFNDTLSAEVACIATFPRHSHLIRPKLIYAFTDRWRGTLGADIFRGGKDTYYGSLIDDSTAYVEMRYGF